MKAFELKSLDLIKEPNDLLDFYRSLGWNGTDQLDPTKIVLNREDDHEIIDNFIEAGPKEERIQRSIFWVNYGPSASADVPRGKIHVYK